MGTAVALFPGQGSQQPGMGRDLHDAFSAARDVFEEVEECVRIPLRRICFESGAEELRRTENAQLALVTHGAAAVAVLRETGDPVLAAAAGHSVGEYTAFHAAGSLGLRALAELVRVRGLAMASSEASAPGTMAAILGEMSTSVAEICELASGDGSLVVPANFNAPGQVVISGHVEAVERAMTLAGEAGARKVTRLNVSGAFHSPLMRTAQAALSEALGKAEIQTPAIPVYTNVAAEACLDGEEARDLLDRQLVSPVRWVDLMRKVEIDYPGILCLELGPGSVLAGLTKRCAPSLRTMPCGTPGDIDAVARVLA
jgi:[acyl-carrier-protein] S-malonyltransferase